MRLRAEIKGIQEAQEHNLRLIASMQPRGAADRGVHKMVISAHRAAVVLTHVDTGALRASHRMSPPSRGVGVLALDKTARNPRSGIATAVYGEYEHNRGGSHAFYDRTVNEFGDQILTLGALTIAREWERGR